jgi:hypothetical protein
MSPREHTKTILEAMRKAMQDVPREFKPTVTVQVSIVLSKAAGKYQGRAMLEG